MQMLFRGSSLWWKRIYLLHEMKQMPVVWTSITGQWQNDLRSFGLESRAAFNQCLSIVVHQLAKEEKEGNSAWYRGKICIWRPLNCWSLSAKEVQSIRQQFCIIEGSISSFCSNCSTFSWVIYSSKLTTLICHPSSSNMSGITATAIIQDTCHSWNTCQMPAI